MCKTMLQVEDVNCFCVDWSGGSRALYTQASNNVRVVGAVVAYFITFLGERFGYSPSLVHVIGHSLGAQTAGEVGKRRPGIGRITALDPAEPYFQGTPPEVRVDPTDAAFVDVIHTDSSSVILHLGTNGYGMSQLVGHLDFFPNGGEQMPGCIPNSLDKILDIDRIFDGGTIPCNHLRSYKYYTDSILRPDGFTGFAADSYQAFKLGVGFPCPSSGCPIMGHYADRYRGVAPADQKYFLNTGADKPFARWRYKVTIKIDGVRDILGNLDVALLGTSGTSEAQQIYTGLIHVGDAYSAFIDSETDVGSLMRVKFYWKNTTIYVFKIGFYPQTITVQNGRDGRTYKFCGNPNNNDQIQTIEACS
uniref:Triacylglycerol lipase n=1 Tax=Leptobrachium leishanense TaxID=445787 RepID=A0A8C5QT34_9ANUR